MTYLSLETNKNNKVQEFGNGSIKLNVRNVEELISADGDDVLVGNQYGNILNAGAGNNFITGGDGNDHLIVGDRILFLMEGLVTTFLNLLRRAIMWCRTSRLAIPL